MDNKSDGHLTDTHTVSACPACKSNNLTTLQPAKSYKIFLTDADEMSVTTGVSCCESCGLTFLSPRMGQSMLYKYYSKQSRIPRNTIDLKSPFARLMEIQLDFIENFKPFKEGHRVLEIGCAEALFLKGIDQRTNGSVELYGVELSEKYIEQAKANLASVNIYESPLENSNFKDVKFDFIVMRHVFEHLSNPVECLEKIRSIIAPGGVLYIEIPDSQQISPAVSRFYHHEHLLYFSPKTLENHLSENGFNCLTCERFEENPVGSGFSYPVIRSVSIAAPRREGNTFPGYAKALYEKNKIRQDAYIDDLLGDVRNRLTQLTTNKANIGIFGAGPHTMDLLELLGGDRYNFVKIFDNNPNKQGKFMRGIPIVKPDNNTINSVDSLLISSAEFETEMIKQAQDLASTELEIIRIYTNENRI